MNGKYDGLQEIIGETLVSTTAEATDHYLLHRCPHHPGMENGLLRRSRWYYTCCHRGPSLHRIHCCRDDAL